MMCMLRCFIFASCALLLTVAARAEVMAQHNEYEVKAAFIYNFARFTQWSEQHENINFCIWGKDVFGRYARVLDGKLVDDRRFVVKNITQFDKTCSLVFISPNEDFSMKQALTALSSTSILTVSDQPGASQQGVMINLFLDNQQRVRFEINTRAIDSAKLKVSAKLLSLGRVVGETQ